MFRREEIHLDECWEGKVGVCWFGLEIDKEEWRNGWRQGWREGELEVERKGRVGLLTPITYNLTTYFLALSNYFNRLRTGKQLATNNICSILN